MKILTVSVACYNVEKFIEEALEPFTMQEIADDIEVLVVNDGSKDNTSKLAHRFEKEYPNTFKVIDKENGGYGSTINAGLLEATGKYFKLLDGDDWYNKECLKKYVDTLKESDEDLIITDGIWVEEETKKETLHLAFDNYDGKRIFSFDEYPKNIGIHAYNTTIKTSLIKDIRITEHCFYTDTEYLIKGLSRCNSIAYYNIPIYMYRIGRDEQSMSFEGLKRHYKDAVRYYKEVLRFEKNNSMSDSFRNNYLNHALVSLAQYHLSTFFLLSPKLKKEYIEFDKHIKKEDSITYKESGTGRINLLRKTKYFGYKVVCWWSKKKFNNRKIV